MGKQEHEKVVPIQSPLVTIVRKGGMAFEVRTNHKEMKRLLVRLARERLKDSNPTAQGAALYSITREST